MTDFNNNEGSKPRVLIVEDDMVLSMVEARMVRDLGYEVAGQVTSGEEAVDQVKSEAPDAILMDIKLQGSMNGLDAVQQINQFNDIPVIYISGHSSKESKQKARDLGCASYLVKPIRTEELKGALKDVFHSREMDQTYSSISLG